MIAASRLLVASVVFRLVYVGLMALAKAVAILIGLAELAALLEDGWKRKNYSSLRTSMLTSSAVRMMVVSCPLEVPEFELGADIGTLATGLIALVAGNMPARFTGEFGVRFGGMGLGGIVEF